MTFQFIYFIISSSISVDISVGGAGVVVGVIKMC